MSDRNVNLWLQRELPKHTQLLSKLRERLEASLEPRREVDADGNVSYVPADVNAHGTPSRDWCRAFQRYAGSLGVILVEDREKAKVAMLAKKAGLATLSDDDYAREMHELGREAVRELSEGELIAEIRRRGLALEPAKSDS